MCRLRLPGLSLIQWRAWKTGSSDLEVQDETSLPAKLQVRGRGCRYMRQPHSKRRFSMSRTSQLPHCDRPASTRRGLRRCWPQRTAVSGSCGRAVPLWGASRRCQTSCSWKPRKRPQPSSSGQGRVRGTGRSDQPASPDSCADAVDPCLHICGAERVRSACVVYQRSSGRSSFLYGTGATSHELRSASRWPAASAVILGREHRGVEWVCGLRGEQPT